MALINKLFPVAQEVAWEKENAVEVPPFGIEEIKEAARKLKNGKAPGPDGIPAEVIKVAAEVIGDYLTEVYNGLLDRGTFPEIWKVARVVFIEKQRKISEEGAKAYRPLCLINTPGKLYEALLNRRIGEELEIKGGLSQQQHGFRTGHSTIGAIDQVMKTARVAHRTHGAWCLLALLDVRNAFNTASWPRIIQAMERTQISSYLINVVKDYLWRRKIQSKAGNHRQCSVGVPQGSVLGPTLWNIMYDEVLRLETMEGVSLVGYADDVAIVVEDKKWEVVQAKMENTIGKVQQWMETNGLELAPEKTELVALKFGRTKREGTIRVANQEIGLSQSARYLGVLLDTSVSFGPHIRAAATRAAKTVTSLERLMPNIGGPGEAKRRMLGCVTNSIMLYAAPIWAGVMNVATYRGVLQSVQRKMALRVIRGYRTVSFDAAVVIASMVPIHLLAAERKRVWELDLQPGQSRRLERENTLRIWQEEWDRGVKGRWTKRLIHDLVAWTARRHGRTDYYLTQWLTGHGSFKSYTKRIGKTADDECEFCGEQDTAEHVVFICQRWATDRTNLCTVLGEEIRVDNIIGRMVRSEEDWAHINAFIRTIMTVKEQEGRR